MDGAILILRAKQNQERDKGEGGAESPNVEAIQEMMVILRRSVDAVIMLCPGSRKINCSEEENQLCIMSSS